MVGNTDLFLIGANMGSLPVSGAATAAPVLADSVFNNLRVYGIRVDRALLASHHYTPDSRLRKWADLGTATLLWMIVVGWDALAGYTFAKVARNWGKTSLSWPAGFRPMY